VHEGSKPSTITLNFVHKLSLIIIWGRGCGIAHPLLQLSASIPVKARKSIGKISEPAALEATQKERVTGF
jgi:hypothetical protein